MHVAPLKDWQERSNTSHLFSGVITLVITVLAFPVCYLYIPDADRLLTIFQVILPYSYQKDVSLDVNFV